MRSWIDELSRALSIARRGRVTDALFFDLKRYDLENEDVQQAIAAGKIRSGYDHYRRYGCWEGRRFALRDWGLGEVRARAVCAATARIERRVDAMVNAARYGELAHRLRSANGTAPTRPIGDWKVPSDAGPWRAPLPRWARRGGWFMLRLTVASPVRAAFAFRALDEDGNPIGSTAALVSKPRSPTHRLIRLPKGGAELEVELLEGELRAQPTGVRLRVVPEAYVISRMLRRLAGHHPFYVSLPEAQIRAVLEREAGENGEAALGAIWQAYESTFPPPVPRSTYHDWIDQVESPELELLDAEAERVIAALGRQPLISIIVPTYNPRQGALRACLDSVLAQSYPRWELCVVDDASPLPHVREELEAHAARDERIRLSFRAENGHICRASNDALALAEGEFVAMLDHDDALPRHALLQLAQAIAAHPDAELFYGDEDKIRDKGFREYPHFKPEWDPELLLGQNYLGHLVAVRTARVREVGGFRPGYEGSQDHDLVLRVTEQLAPRQIVHIPRILYHWRQSADSTASASEAKPYTAVAGLTAVRDALARRGTRATVEHATVANCYRVSPALPTPAPLVSIIVPTRDAPELLATCVKSLLEKTDYPSFELLLVDNGTRAPEAVAQLERAARDPRVRVLRDGRPFNYSALNNAAVAQAKGELVALVNNDIEVLDPTWLGKLAAHAVRPGIGCVGPKLLYPDGTIQHAGVVLGLQGVAGHVYRKMSGAYHGYYGRLAVTHSVSAVTGACLVVRRALYDEVGGLDERQLAVAFNDVDFCIKIRESGHRNLLVPSVVLVHHESASRGCDFEDEQRERFVSEIATMKRRWGRLLYEDPCYSPHLSLHHIDYSIGVRH